VIFTETINKNINIKIMRYGLTLFFAASALVGCASPEVIQERQARDETLKCPQLLAAVDEAKDFERKARGERKATGTNVAAAIFFWPGLIATYSNTEDAITAAKERQNHLMKLYSEKKCAEETTTTASSSQLEKKLTELKAMHEKGLLNETEYQAARKKTLGL
jgi:hypothetical protein